MPLTQIFTIVIFDSWGIVFIVAFLVYNGYVYILVVVDYLSELIKTAACRNNDQQIVIMFLIEHILLRSEVPKAIISNGVHICIIEHLRTWLKHTTSHKISTQYHPQPNEQAKLSNREIKQIEKIVNQSHKDWSFWLVDT